VGCYGPGDSESVGFEGVGHVFCHGCSFRRVFRINQSRVQTRYVEIVPDAVDLSTKSTSQCDGFKKWPPGVELRRVCTLSLEAKGLSRGCQTSALVRLKSAGQAYPYSFPTIVESLQDAHSV
jgi:hypothetical protein